MIYGLTQKQSNCLSFIKTYVANNNFSPSYQEIAEGIGTKSKGEINRLMNCLKERGYVNFIHGKSRTISILDMPRRMAHV